MERGTEGQRRKRKEKRGSNRQNRTRNREDERDEEEENYFEQKSPSMVENGIIERIGHCEPI